MFLFPFNNRSFRMSTYRHIKFAFVTAMLLAVPSVSQAVNWDFQSNQSLQGWTELNHQAFFNSDGLQAKHPTNNSRAHDSAHPVFLVESPSFWLTGLDSLAGGTAFRTVTQGGAGNQNGSADPANPAAVLAHNSGNSSSLGQKGAALYDVLNDSYLAVLYDPGNGGTNQVAAQNFASLGANTSSEYRIHIFDTDDGSWGWTAWRGVEIDATFSAPVPEPATAALAAIGFGGLMMRRRRMA